MVQELKKKKWREKQKEEIAKCEHLGIEYIQSKPPEKEVKKEAIEIEREQEFAITCSSEDDRDSIKDFETKSRKSHYSSQMGKAQDISDKAKSSQYLSPQVFRKKAQRRMNFFQKKFSNNLDEIEE